jgi:pyruvate dehydrogenase E1 component alpha subunit
MAFGVPAIAVDGNDVLAVYRVASESIFKARHRRGPTLIECVTSVVPGSNGDSTYARQEIGVVDPLLALETDLVRKGILTTVRKRENLR